MAERVKDDDTRELEEARRKSAEVKAAFEKVRRQKEKAEAEARLRARNANKPTDKPVYGPPPKPQTPEIPANLKTWKKVEEPQEKLKSWDKRPHPLTEEDSKNNNAFDQWVRRKTNEEKETKTFLPTVNTPQPTERRQELPPPLQLARPSVDTSAPSIGISGIVGAQTQPARRQPTQPAVPDILRGQYQQPERRTYDVPERPAAMGVPGIDQINQWWRNRAGLTEESHQSHPLDFAGMAVDESRRLMQKRGIETENSIWNPEYGAKWYQNSGAKAFEEARSERRWNEANMTDAELQARADELAEQGQQIADENPVQALLGGGQGNSLVEGWQMVRPKLDWFGDVMANVGSVVGDAFDKVAVTPAYAMHTEPMQDDGAAPAMWWGAGHDEMMRRTGVLDDDPTNDQPAWINFIVGAGGALAGAGMALGLQPGDPEFVENVQQSVQQGIDLVNRVRALPEDERKQAAAAIPNFVSGVDAAQKTFDFITTRKEEVAKLKQQAEQAKAESMNPAYTPESRQQLALQAAQLGAQANSMENLYIADIVEMNQDPMMEFLVGLLLDPMNLLDAPIGAIADTIRAGKIAKRLGAVGEAVSEVDAIKHLDNAVAQADELLTRVAAGEKVDLRTLKGRPAAEKASKGIRTIFGKTKETLVQQRTEQVFNVLSGLIPKGVSASDARIILQTLIEDPRKLIDGLPVSMFTSPALTDTFNFDGVVKWGNGLVAPKFLNEYLPVLRFAKDDLLNMLPLNHAGALDAPAFIAAVDDIVMDSSRRLYGMSDLPANVPVGTSKIEVRRAPTTRGQAPSQDGVLIYKDSQNNVLGQSAPMPMSAAKTQRADLLKAAEASATTGGARIAANVGNVLTLRPLLTDLYLGLRPANWVKNAASAYAVMFADGAGSFKPLSEIENYLTTKMGDLMGNQRVAQAIAGDGPLRTQFGVVEGPHWLEKVWKNNPYSKIVKKSLEIPYGNTGIKVGNVEFPVGEQNFYARIFQSAFERTFTPAIEKVTHALIAPLVQQGLDPQVAKHVTDYLNHVGRTGTKEEYAQAIKRIFGNANVAPVGGVVPPVNPANAPIPGAPNVTGNVTPPAAGTIPPSPAAYGVPNGVLAPQTERTVMEAIASGDMEAVDAAMAAELRKHIDVAMQNPAQAGSNILTETAIINEAEDLEDLARMAGQDASELVSRFVQTRRAAYQPLLNDLATSASTVEAADVITAFMGVTRKLQEDFWKKIDNANKLAVMATENTTGGTSGVHAIRWQEVQRLTEQYLQDFQNTVASFRSRLAAGNIGQDVVMGRNIFNKLVTTPDIARPAIEGALEYGTTQYAAVIAANKAAMDRAYLNLWDAARRNPSMLAMDVMLEADDKVGDIYRALAVDIEEHKAWLRGLGPGDHTAEWGAFRLQRDEAWAEMHRYAESVYDSARAAIVKQSVGDTTYKAGNATYRIVSKTDNGWRIQKIARDGTPSKSVTEIFPGDRAAPPRDVARKWLDAQEELLAPPAPKPSTVVDDRLPEAPAPAPSPVAMPEQVAPVPMTDNVEIQRQIDVLVNDFDEFQKRGTNVRKGTPEYDARMQEHEDRANAIHALKRQIGKSAFDDPNIVTAPVAPPMRPTNDLFTAAKQAGIVTATKDGRPLNQHLLNSINKHGKDIGLDRKIARIDELTDDEMQRAIAYYNARPSVAKKAAEKVAPVTPAAPANQRPLPPAFGTSIRSGTTPDGYDIITPAPAQPKLVNYNWVSRKEEFDNGIDIVTRRVSDWDQSSSATQTGRDIVHHYWIWDTDGTVKPYGKPTAIRKLGLETKSGVLDKEASKILAANKEDVDFVKAWSDRLPALVTNDTGEAISNYRRTGGNARPEDTRRWIKDGQYAITINEPRVADYMQTNGWSLDPDYAHNPKAASAPAPVAPATPSLVGNKTQAWSDPSKPVDVQYEVLEYDDLIVSNLAGGQVNPNYPSTLQPRDRTQVASRMQVDNIAQNLQPRELLSLTESVANGSPIVNADNVVESGNGRMMALGISPSYGNYKTQLIANASQYGIDPAQIQGMNRPVLVRRRLSGEDSVSFAQSANARQTLSMNAIEQGRVLADRMSPQVLTRYHESGGTLANIDTVAGSQFSKSIIGMLPPNEQAAYISPTGKVTAQGTDFVRSVLFATVFEDDSVLRNYVLAVDPDLRNVGNAFEAAIIDLAVLEKTLPELAIGQDLSDAANTLIHLRSTGTSVDEFLAQGAMFDERSPEFVALLRYMNDNIRSGSRIGSALRDYARRATEFNPNQVTMFAEAAPEGKLDLLQRALQGSKPPETLFGGFGFVPPDGWLTGWAQNMARGRANMGHTSPQVGAAASHQARQLANAWVAFRRGGGAMPALNLTTAQQMAALDGVNNAMKMWDDAIVWSQHMANRAADYAMLNFNDRRNFDTLFGIFMPYSYFWSRSMLNWTKRLARKPSLLNLYYEVERDRARSDRMNQVENMGLPARVEGRFPAIGDWFMSNPFNLFLPVNSYFGNEFVDPELATTEAERRWMQFKKWTPAGGVGIDVGMAFILDQLAPRGEGAQPRIADFGIGDYAPIMKQATSIYQGATGNIAPSWLSGDPYAYGTAGRTVATNLDIDPNLRKWALDVGTQLLRGLPPLPEQPEEAERIWTEAVKEAGWTDWQAKAMAFVLGLPFAKVAQDERTMRQDRNTRRGLGYNGGANEFGSKAAVDAWDEQTGDAATLLAQYSELYPSNSASNPDAIDYGRPGLSAARDERGAELDTLKAQRDAEIEAFKQANAGMEKHQLNAGISAIYDKYEAQEAEIKARYPSVEDGNFNPSESYYRNHSPEEMQAAQETAAKYAAQEKERQEIFDQFGENIYDLQDQYFDLPEGSQARRDFLATNPQLKSYWEWNRKQEGKQNSSKGLKGSSTNEEYAAKRTEAESMFGAGIWDVVDGYNRDWSQEEKSAYFREHPELLAFWDFWYGENEATGGGSAGSGRRTYSRPFIRSGFPGVSGPRGGYYIPPRPDTTGDYSSPVETTYDPEWAQYQQQAAQTWQPGQWRPSNRRDSLRDIPLATLRAWA